MKLSNKILSMDYSPIRKFVKYAKAAELEGKKVYYLNIGQPDIKTPEEFIRAINDFHTDVLEYAPSEGMPKLINAIQQYYNRYGMKYDNNNILVTNGGSEALSFIMTAILDEGDEVIIPEPFYTNYGIFISMAGGKIIPLTTFVEDGYHYADRERIEALITHRTRAILLSNPGNPTGTVLSEEEIKMISDIAAEHDLFVIADEVYREFVYDNKKVASFGQIESAAENIVLVDSISKRFSACGARVGSIVTKNQELYNNLIKLAQGRLSCPTLEQIGAVTLYNLSPSYIDSVKAEYEKRRDIVYDELNKIDGIICRKPEGALYMTAKLPIMDVEDFLYWMLTEFEDEGETAMFAPAEGFYYTENYGKDEVRIAYVLKQEDMIRAIELLKIGLDLYINKKAENA